MNVQKLINTLKNFNMSDEVYLSSDSEGNSFGTIEKCSMEQNVGFIIIYPYEEGLDYDELQRG